MRDYLSNSDFYLKIFPCDPKFDNVRLLKFFVENNNAYITLGLVNYLPEKPPKDWNKNKLNSTKFVVSFLFFDSIIAKNISQAEFGSLRLKREDSKINAIFSGNAGDIEIFCDFISIDGVISYNET